MGGAQAVASSEAARAERDAPFAADAAAKRRQSGMSRAQRRTLDAMHPEGWTVAYWIQPDVLLDPNDRRLDTSDNPNLYGGGHFVVNGTHVIISRRGKWIGYYAWGGRDYPKNGGRKPWNAIVSEPGASGHYGDHRTPRHRHIVRSRYL